MHSGKMEMSLPAFMASLTNFALITFSSYDKELRHTMHAMKSSGKATRLSRSSSLMSSGIGLSIAACLSSFFSEFVACYFLNLASDMADSLLFCDKCDL